LQPFGAQARPKATRSPLTESLTYPLVGMGEVEDINTLGAAAVAIPDFKTVSKIR
jgi:hypothetical protein